MLPFLYTLDIGHYVMPFYVSSKLTLTFMGTLKMGRKRYPGLKALKICKMQAHQCLFVLLPKSELKLKKMTKKRHCKYCRVCREGQKRYPEHSCRHCRDCRHCKRKRYPGKSVMPVLYCLSNLKTLPFM